MKTKLNEYEATYGKQVDNRFMIFSQTIKAANLDEAMKIFDLRMAKEVFTSPVHWDRLTY